MVPFLIFLYIETNLNVARRRPKRKTKGAPQHALSDL